MWRRPSWLWLRVVRALTVPLALFGPSIFWVVDGARRMSYATLGRDQGIFQYVAWALSRGAVDYRDVRDVNGPLTHFIHLLFFRLGGADEHRFRVLDLTVSAVSFAVAGAALANAGGRRVPRPSERIAWGVAGCAVLGSQYLAYGFWDTAQRESFFDWFLLPSLALQVAARRRGDDAKPFRHGAATYAICGALSVVPWFGKPTYGFFTILQIVVLALDAEGGRARRAALGAFIVGAAAGAASLLLFLFAWGDPVAFARIQFVDVPAMYRFIWPRSAADILSIPLFSTPALFAVAGAVVYTALAAAGAMPKRLLVIGFSPLCALASVFAQAKGFPYHFHPVTACVALQWLAFVAWLERACAGAVPGSRRYVPLAAATAVALYAGQAAADSPYVRDTWLLGAAARRGSADYFRHFVRVDFFPDEMRDAAAFVRARTSPTETVQTYGMDPYVLFLARRLSATPYIYAYDLNADAALAGGPLRRPDAAEAARIRAMRDAHEEDMLRRLAARPPAAFVFVDGSPPMSEADAVADFERHCRRTASWMEAHYAEAERFGHFHVWLAHNQESGLDHVE